MRKKLDTELLIKRFKEKHGDKYDYSKIEYIDQQSKVCIICPIHGEFWQTPNNHLNGRGCPICKNEKTSKRCRSTNDEFIRKARKIHGNKYDYSKVNYNRNENKVCIICPEHGEFWQTPHKHLSGHGCQECGKRRKKITTEEWIKKAREVHRNKYNYSKVEYVDEKNKVCIICPEHGEFWQVPSYHLSGNGCKMCRKDLLRKKFSLTKEEFIDRAKQIHGGKYDYTKVEYVNSQTKVCIICSEHGEFWQKPFSHLSGRGCPVCKESKLENYIATSLEQEKIRYVRSKRFPWLKAIKHMHLDFYLPDYNIAIECQGIQHFTFGNWYKDKDAQIAYFKEIIYRDELKYKLCSEHGIKLIYYTTYEFNKNESDIYHKWNTFNTFNKIKKYIYDTCL